MILRTSGWTCVCVWGVVEIWSKVPVARLRSVVNQYLHPLWDVAVPVCVCLCPVVSRLHTEPPCSSSCSYCIVSSHSIDVRPWFIGSPPPHTHAHAHTRLGKKCITLVFLPLYPGFDATVNPDYVTVCYRSLSLPFASHRFIVYHHPTPTPYPPTGIVSLLWGGCTRLSPIDSGKSR